MMDFRTWYENWWNGHDKDPIAPTIYGSMLAAYNAGREAEKAAQHGAQADESILVKDIVDFVDEYNPTREYLDRWLRERLSR